MPPRRNIDLDLYDEQGRLIKKKRDMSDLQVIKRILGFLTEPQFRKLVYLFFVVMIIGSIVGFLMPWLFGRLVDEGMGGGTEFHKTEFYYYGSIIFVLMIISFILWIGQQYSIYYLATSLMHRLRKRLFANLQRLSFDYFDDASRSSGKIISYLTNDVETIHQLVSAGLLNIFANLFQLGGALILMFATSVHLTILSFGVIGIIILVGVPFLLKTRQYFVIMRRTVGEVTGNLQEAISGIRLIKAFSFEKKSWNKFHKSIVAELKINLKVQKLFSAMPGLIMTLLGGGLGIMLVASTKLLEANLINGIGTIFQFALYMLQFFGPIVGLIMFINQIQNSMTAGERIIKLIDLKPSIRNKADEILLNPKGEMLFEVLLNKNKAKKKYGHKKVSEITEEIKKLDPLSIKFIKTIGISIGEKKFTQNKIKLSKKDIFDRDDFLKICYKFEEFLEPFKETELDRLKLSDKGYKLYVYLKSKRSALKRYSKEELSDLIESANKFSKYEKKIFKLIGSGSVYALPSPKTPEIESLMDQLYLTKKEILELYEKNKKYLRREKPIEIENLKGHIEFNNVSFSYIKGIPVIKNLSMEIKPGERIAIVGYTGAGKSTIINLLCRFYDIDEGAILVDGVDLRDLNIHSLRQKMGIVLQDNYLFSGTVMENIRYGKPDATDEEVIESAKKVNAHEFIINLPNGYQTEIEERGNLLSIGQKQLIAFARALIRDPPILIFDEATSAVDPYSELLIQQALEVLLKNRTSISIAHRLSTIINSDRIYCLKDGEIVEVGSHHELIQNPNGLYTQLYSLQFRDPFKEDEKYSEQAEETVTT
ncbi:MAG: ABC transporter ATP-binding protein [Promethearchaeota archaeon]